MEEDDPVAVLREAAATLSTVRDRIREIDVEDLSTVADAYRSVERILDRYEGRATDWDDIEGYVRFREAFSERLAALPEDLPHREAFSEADDELTTGPHQALSASDFERARSHLAPVREVSTLYQRQQEARERYRNARRATVRYRDEYRERATELERVRDLGEAGLDEPIEQLRAPIAAYNERIGDAFETFRQETPARTVLEFVADASAYPLIEYRQPPERLYEYVQDSQIGEESIPTLLEYADYSSSKLDHYVEDTQTFRAAIATNRTYLRRLDADPLTVDVPPPPSAELHWWARELVSVVARFADEETVALARGVRALADHEEYDRLRESLIARRNLDADERERLQSGAVERDLREVRTEVARVEEALDEYPPLSAIDEQNR